MVLCVFSVFLEGHRSLRDERNSTNVVLGVPHFLSL